MLPKFLFKRLSIQKQISTIQTRGVMLGSRMKDGRKIYIYMLRDLFMEVHFKNDSADEAPEKIIFLNGLKHLNDHLEQEFKNSF